MRAKAQESRRINALFTNIYKKLQRIDSALRRAVACGLRWRNSHWEIKSEREVSRLLRRSAVNRRAACSVEEKVREIRAAAMGAAVEDGTADLENIAMRTRNLLLATLVAATLGSVSGPAAARTDVDVQLNFGPPAVRYEAVPGPRRGYHWQPGYWGYRGGKHAWAKGYWVRERPGYYWHPHRWVEADGRWVLRRGAYSRDRDYDGVPDRFDRRPGDPTRR